MSTGTPGSGRPEAQRTRSVVNSHVSLGPRYATVILPSASPHCFRIGAVIVSVLPPGAGPAVLPPAGVATLAGVPVGAGCFERSVSAGPAVSETEIVSRWFLAPAANTSINPDCVPGFNLSGWTLTSRSPGVAPMLRDNVIHSAPCFTVDWK